MFLTLKASHTSFFVAIFLNVVLLISCGKKESLSVDPQPPPVEELKAVVTSVSSNSVAVGEQIVITGRNFSEVAEENIVNVNSTRALLLSSSTTQLQVKIAAGTKSGALQLTVAGKQATMAVSSKVMVYGFVETFAGGFQGMADGSGESAMFWHPGELAFDNHGNLIVADCYNYRIRKISPDAVVETIAGTGSTTGFHDGPAAEARFGEVYGLVVDSDENLYFSDTENNKIRKLSSSGTITTFAGSGYDGNQNGPALTATFKSPFGLALDKEGALYVADGENHCIRKIAFGVVSTFAGVPNVSGMVDGPSGSAKFNYPTGLAFDADQNLIVVDLKNYSIRKISSTGVVSTIAGTGVPGYADGPGRSAQFKSPWGLTIDLEGNIIVTDMENHRLRLIDVNGEVQTIAGNGSAGRENARADLASFNIPSGITRNGQGEIFIADFWNDQIRKYSP